MLALRDAAGTAAAGETANPLLYALAQALNGLGREKWWPTLIKAMKKSKPVTFIETLVAWS